MPILTALMLLAAAPAETSSCPIRPPVTHDLAWRTACDAAIAAAQEPRLKAELLFRSGYVYNEQNNLFDAERALQEAARLDPANANAWHELGFTENALGNYAPAEAALDREVALTPDAGRSYQERAMARHFLGNFEGAYADRDRVAHMRTDGGALLGRAEEAMWLGRFDQAAADLDAASARGGDDALPRQVEHARTLLQRERVRSTAVDASAACAETGDNETLQRPGFIGDCTAAYLAETRPGQRATFLTTRAMAWLVAAQDQEASTADLVIAAALEPGNPDRHTNLGFSFLTRRHSWAASREFDRALAIREGWLALAGRASAKYVLHDADGAFADARRSFELHPNEVALTVMGDLFHDRGDNAAAKRFWMGAYRLGDRDDGLIARLNEIGVAHPENEPAGH